MSPARERVDDLRTHGESGCGTRRRRGSMRTAPLSAATWRDERQGCRWPAGSRGPTLVGGSRGSNWLFIKGGYVRPVIVGAIVLGPCRGVVGDEGATSKIREGEGL